MSNRPSTDEALRMAETALHAESVTLDAAADTLLNDETNPARDANRALSPALRTAVDQLRMEARRFRMAQDRLEDLRLGYLKNGESDAADPE